MGKYQVVINRLKANSKKETAYYAYSEVLRVSEEER